MDAKVLLVGAGLAALLAVGPFGCFSSGPAAHYASGEVRSPDEVAGPLVAEVATHRKGSNVVFYFQLRDATGARIRYLNDRDGLADAPQVEVLDSEGNAVYRGTMKYG